jgi:hypothetical protein
MRSSSLLALALVLAGCNAREAGPSPAPSPTPTPAPEAAGAVVAPGAKGTAVAPAAPVSIVFARLVGNAPREVAAALEDGSRGAVTLSRPGVDSTFAGALSAHRVLVAAHDAGGALASIDVVRADGAGRRELGALPKGRYAKVLRAEEDGAVVVLELAHADAPTVTDIVAVRAGEAPVTVAPRATLVAVHDGRVAYLERGALKSAATSGREVRALGGDDHDDRVVEARDGRLLVTLHASGAGDVRVTDLAGRHVDVGAPGVDDRAVGFAPGDRVVFSRVAAGKRVLFAMGADGHAERALTPADLDAEPAAVTPSGDVLLFRPEGALALAPVDGGPLRVLDVAPGADARVVKVLAGHVFTLAEAPAGAALRAAKLDGSGATDLCNKPLWRPYFGTVTSDGRAIFYRTLAGQPDGGLLFSVKLDGTDLRPVGSAPRDGAGNALGVPADQDFEAITPQGRVVLEAELQGTASNLFTSAGGADATRVSDHAHARFAGLTRP